MGRNCRGGYIFLQNIVAIEGVVVMVSLEVWVCRGLEECGDQGCFGSARNVEETEATIRHISMEDFFLGHLEQVCIYEFL